MRHGLQYQSFFTNENSHTSFPTPHQKLGAFPAHTDLLGPGPICTGSTDDISAEHPCSTLGREHQPSYSLSVLREVSQSDPQCSDADSAYGSRRPWQPSHAHVTDSIRTTDDRRLPMSPLPNIPLYSPLIPALQPLHSYAEPIVPTDGDNRTVHEAVAGMVFHEGASVSCERPVPAPETTAAPASDITLPPISAMCLPYPVYDQTTFVDGQQCSATVGSNTTTLSALPASIYGQYSAYLPGTRHLTSVIATDRPDLKIASIRDVVDQTSNNLWAHIHNLENRVTRMQDGYELRISRMQEEVMSLRAQMLNHAS